MDPTKLQAFMKEPNGGVSSAGLKASNSRQAKRLIISNIPEGNSEETILSFFNLQLNGLNVIESPDPCTLCQFSTDRSFAVLEFRNASDATVAVALDGISMDADDAMNGASGEQRGLSIRRPKDYVMPAIPEEMEYDPEVVSNVVPDTVHKLSITNIPSFLTEEQIIELLAAFGKPKAFVLVKDRSTEESRVIYSVIKVINSMLTFTGYCFRGIPRACLCQRTCTERLEWYGRRRKEAEGNKGQYWLNASCQFRCWYHSHQRPCLSDIQRC